MMQDRPDLIQSELAGLAFDSLQQVFRKIDIEFAFDTAPLPMEMDQTVWVVVDPAAGGPSSDFAVLSMCRSRGCVTVCTRPGARMRSALGEQIAVDALLDEDHRRAPLVGEEADREYVAEVGEEPGHLAQVRVGVHRDDAVLEHRVDVQQQEENGDECALRTPRDYLSQAANFTRDALARKCDLYAV